jgi:hypothetical protein
MHGHSIPCANLAQGAFLTCWLLLLQVLAHLLSVCGERRSSLGIVTPYIAQLNLLSQQLAGLASAATAAPARASSSTQQQQQQGADELATTAVAAAADVLEIKTVDGYQGREKEVVLFSAVRANAQAQVGYQAVTYVVCFTKCCCCTTCLLCSTVRANAQTRVGCDGTHTQSCRQNVLCRSLLLYHMPAVSQCTGTRGSLLCVNILVLL